jgi:hypothetical protein
MRQDAAPKPVRDIADRFVVGDIELEEPAMF